MQLQTMPSRYGPPYRWPQLTSASSFSTVSSFYGPGSFTAWILLLLASWISTLQGKRSHNIHHISYLLYTNWAAIDLFRNLRKPEPVPGSDLSASQYESQRHEIAAQTIASICVLHLGVLNTCAQLAACMWMNDSEKERKNTVSAPAPDVNTNANANPDPDTVAGKTSPSTLLTRARILALALLLPLTSISLGIHLDSKVIFHISHDTSILQHVSLFGILMWGYLLGRFGFSFFCIEASTRWYLKESVVFGGVVGAVYVYFCTIVFGLLGRKAPGRCYMVPCTEVGWDADQVFVVGAGVVMFAYEYGGGTWEYLRRRVGGLWEGRGLPMAEI